MIARIVIGFVCIESILFGFSFFIAVVSHDEYSKDNIPLWGAAVVFNVVAVALGILYLLMVGIEFAFTGVVNW